MHVRRTTDQQTVRFEGFEVEFHGTGGPRLPQRQSNEGSWLGKRHCRRLRSLCLCSGRDGVYVAEDFDVGRRRFVQRQVEEVDVRRKGVAGKYYLCTDIENKRRYFGKITYIEYIVGRNRNGNGVRSIKLCFRNWIFSQEITYIRSWYSVISKIGLLSSSYLFTE